ncbi:SET and MYND domain-containing protein 3 [Pteropus alecto]|uniref:[histone H3]-lysine(4) N-trimethyltransferase n=1 Tax=Pteropus alecto TaxID=9402 RepID=L5KGD0_PTEAL|nr:SET and MYND domain-containing protein 3 [Pteropus alecto]
MQEVGVGLYPSMSLLNHSCDPNCSIVFNGPHLLLRAVRDIEAGEELTICYLDMLMTSEERRKQLRDQYCFECDCSRCQTQDKDADMLTGDEQVWKEVQESLKKIEELKAHWKWEQVLAMCQAIISSNSERLPDINIYQLKVLDCAMDACINLGLLEEALFYGIRTMEPYRKERRGTCGAEDGASRRYRGSPVTLVNQLSADTAQKLVWAPEQELDVTGATALRSHALPLKSSADLVCGSPCLDDAHVDAVGEDGLRPVLTHLSPGSMQLVRANCTDRPVRSPCWQPNRQRAKQDRSLARQSGPVQAFSPLMRSHPGEQETDNEPTAPRTAKLASSQPVSAPRPRSPADAESY